MDKRIKIILISVIVILAILCGIFLIYKNYQYGKEMYCSVIDVKYRCVVLSSGIKTMQEIFQDPNIDPEGIEVDSFDRVLTATRIIIGYEDMALEDDVRHAYVERCLDMQLHYFSPGHNNTLLAESFTDPEKAADVEAFKNDIENLEAGLNDFANRYNEMSFLERCFTSWSHEREELSDKVRLP